MSIERLSEFVNRAAIFLAPSDLDTIQAALERLAHLERCMAADSRVQTLPPCKCAPSWGLIALSLLLGIGGGFALALALVRMGGALA